MTKFIPLTKLPSATVTVEIMLKQVFHVHGFPRNILSDWGPQFIAQFWKVLCKLIGATVSLTSGYHPETNGQSEWVNQNLEMGLRCLVSRDPLSWSKQLFWVEVPTKLLSPHPLGYPHSGFSLAITFPFADTEPEAIDCINYKAFVGSVYLGFQ